MPRMIKPLRHKASTAWGKTIMDRPEGQSHSDTWTKHPPH